MKVEVEKENKQMEYKNVEKALKIVSASIKELDKEKEISLVEISIAMAYMSKLLLKSLQTLNLLTEEGVKIIEEKLGENLKVEDLKQIIEKFVKENKCEK